MITTRYQLLTLLLVHFLFFVGRVYGDSHFEVCVDSPEIIAKYVSSLIKIESTKDSLRNHDVALIQIELNNKSEAFSAIIREVLKQNPEKSVFIHSTRDRIAENRIHAASVFVITTDLANHVRTILN